RDAADRGAEIRCRALVESAEREADHWVVRVRDQRTAEVDTLRARALINAAGPWVENVLSGRLLLKPKAHTRLVQGSHIVVRKLYDHDRAYILQNPDGRIVFTIPFDDGFTLIGTTDRDYEGDPGKVTASDEDIAYLCEAVSGNFARPVTVGDVVWSYSGVRPLYDDGASEAKAATRDYVLEVDAVARAPVVSIFGGKITNYRRRAQAAISRSTDCRISSAISASLIRSSRSATSRGSRAPTARAPAACWAPRAGGRNSERALETL